MHKMIGLSVLVIVITACSSIVVDTENIRRNSRMDLFRSIPGKAVLYVYRDASLKDGYYTSNLIINGHRVSTGALNSFNVLILPAGEYVIGVTSSFQKGDYLPMDVTFRAGEVYYLNEYWEKDAGFEIRAVIDSRAKKVISAARLIAIQELCPEYSIDADQKKQLGNSQVFFRPYKQGICTNPSP